MRCLSLLLFFCFHATLVAQPMRIDDRERATEIFKIRDAIRQAKGTLAAWEGEYSGDHGADTFVEIFVSAKHGLALLEHGIFGIHAGNVGSIQVENSEITVTLKHKDRIHGSFSTHLLIIPWGDTYFLVPRGRVHGFCLRAKDRPQWLLDEAFCQKRTKPKKLVGLPSIPEKYKACMTAVAIKTQITGVDKAKIEKLPNGMFTIAQTVSLDCGEQSGVYVGMELEMQDLDATLTVTKLGKDTCEAAFEQTVHPLSDLSDGLTKGMVFKTPMY